MAIVSLRRRQIAAASLALLLVTLTSLTPTVSASEEALLLHPTKTLNNDNQHTLHPTSPPQGYSPHQCSNGDNDNTDSCAAAVNVLQKRQEDEGDEDPAPTASRNTNVPQNAANGGLSMTQPPLTAQATFHKIAESNYITFGWQFTDVLVQPETLTLQAYCSQNGYTYPVGPTNGIAGDSTQYAWNPYEYERNGGATPLAEASYTLRIFDERGYFAAPTAGWMRPYAGTVFALYRPQKYVGLQDGWVCAACSAALRSIPVHPAVLATSVSVLAGALLVFARIH